MDTLGIILARAGSKGLPGKSTRTLGGKPVVVWTIEHALSAQLLNCVVVSTDDPEVARISGELGVEVITRPAALATDTATVDSAARHAVETAESSQGSPFDGVVILYANVPLRSEGLADLAAAKLASTGADSVQSVCPVGKLHPYWMKKLGGSSGDVLDHYAPNDVYRRQDLPPVYQLDGGVIAVTRRSLFTVDDGQPHAFLGSDRRAVVTQQGQVVDIDTELDLDIAQALVARRGGEGNPVAQEEGAA